MDKEIIEGNRLIGEFMGMKEVAEEAWADNSTGEFKILGEYRPHSDWNELMPVVERLESSADQNTGHITVVIQGQMCEILQYDFQKRARYSHGSKPKIEIVWNAVVQFIQWYNTQTKNS